MVKPEDIPKFAGRIHSEASRLSSLVEDIIKLSRLDENDQSIPMEEVDLMQICRDVEGHLSIRAKEQLSYLSVFCILYFMFCVLSFFVSVFFCVL